MTVLDDHLRSIVASESAALADPYPVFNRMRELSRVYPLEPITFVGRYDDCIDILKDPRFLTNTHGAGSHFQSIRRGLAGKELQALDEVTAFEENYVSRANGEMHARLRRIGQRLFTPTRLTRLRDKTQVHMNQLLDGIKADRDGSFDLYEIAYQLPLRVIGELLGIPQKDLPQIHLWSSAIGRNRGGTETPELMAAHAAIKEFIDYTENMVGALRDRVSGGADDDLDLDVVRDLIGAEQDERLTMTELTAMFIILLFAGHETTKNLIASGTLALLTTNQWTALEGNPSLLPNAIDELLRYVSPVQWTGRIPTEDIEFAGTTLKAGSTIFLMFVAANRDPRIFDNPDTLDLGRTNARRHLAFGNGAHTCIGLQLAKLEATIAFETMLRRFPRLRLQPEGIEWGGNSMLRGLMRFRVAT